MVPQYFSVKSTSRSFCVGFFGAIAQKELINVASADEQFLKNGIKYYLIAPTITWLA